MKPILEIKNISKKFLIHNGTSPYLSLRDKLPSLLKKNKAGSKEVFWALENVCLNIYPGESVGIVGRNGAGKSTLLKILSKITPPSSGKVISRGRVASLLEVGTGFHPELSGRENIFFNGAILGMKRAEIIKKFDAIVSFAGVEKFIDTPLKHYSSGMQLRIAFAVAAFLDPEILIVDEVLAVGDAEFQKKCLNRMKAIGEEGRTILFVSHNMTAIKNLCRKAVLMEKGNIVSEGNSTAIITSYLSSFIEESGRKHWEIDKRPGNRFIKLNTVQLKNPREEPTSAVNLSEEATVEIEFDVIEEGAQAIFSLVLTDSEGYCIFGSLSNTEPEFYGKSLCKGQYLTRCKIYGNLLNNVRYFVSVLGYGAHWSDHFRADNVLSFEGIDDGILKKDYYGDYGGVIRPVLEWATQKKI